MKKFFLLVSLTFFGACVAQPLHMTSSASAEELAIKRKQEAAKELRSKKAQERERKLRLEQKSEKAQSEITSTDVSPERYRPTREHVKTPRWPHSAM